MEGSGRAKRVNARALLPSSPLLLMRFIFISPCIGPQNALLG